LPCHGPAATGEICVRGGVFTMGHDPIPDPRSSLAKLPQLQAPRHRVRLPPFFIDERPITNEDYKACLDATACPDECQTAGTKNSTGASVQCEARGTFYQTYHVRDASLARYPVATVYDSGAEAYCAWRGKRLPTEAEWERAARGPQSGDYPWGDAAPACAHYGCGLVPLNPDPSQPFFPVGTYPVDRSTGDVSPEGARMMVTGVAEFLHDWHYSYPYDNGEPITSPQGMPSPSVGQSARGNVLALIPLYNGTVDLPADQAIEPFPQPAWARAALETILVGGFRCARSDD
jgi:formylglycine-generating enzyme required for sulfatase activity